MTDKVMIIGCGMCGSVIARELADNGVNVEIYEKRDHIGGNVYDFVDGHGFLVCKHGPHALHTNNDDVIKYINRFESWKPYYLKCAASWDGISVPSPFNYATIDAFYSKAEAQRLKTLFNSIFKEKKEITVLDALHHENADVRAYAEFLFKNDYSPYTSKQWGIKPEDIDVSVLARVPIRMSYQEGYFSDKYQIYPEHSYSAFFRNLLDSDKIKIHLNTNALDFLRIDNAVLYIGDHEADCPVVYTGAIDELYKNEYGSLPYRSLRFEWKYEDIDSYQSEAIVSYPKADGYTRITEYKKIPVQNKKGTVYAIEYPVSYSADSGYEAYYPVITQNSTEIYNKYFENAKNVPNLYCCGRLADYKYYNMDQAIVRALEISRKILADINE